MCLTMYDTPRSMNVPINPHASSWTAGPHRITLLRQLTGLKILGQDEVPALITVPVFILKSSCLVVRGKADASADCSRLAPQVPMNCLSNSVG